MSRRQVDPLYSVNPSNAYFVKYKYIVKPLYIVTPSKG